MQISSYSEGVTFDKERIETKLILESSFSKEIRVVLKKGQIMKEHQTPFPIVVHLLEGAIDFGAQGVIHPLSMGDIITLEGGIPHDLTATENSVVRLSLSKLDQAERVEKAANPATG
jgi:quercetin dioxygenase-like cupin family protein